MLSAIVINSFFIITLTFLIQVPVFLWLYKNLVKNTHIDYIYTSFWFLVVQLAISIILICTNNFINLDNILGSKVWYNSSTGVSFKIFTGIIVNIIFVGILVIILNKLVLKLKVWDNFFINFVLLLMLIVIIPLVFYLYLMFQPNNVGV